MGIELVLNSANIAFVTFTRYVAVNISGYAFVIFIIILAAAEAAVALAIIINIVKNFKTVDVDETKELKY
jgi:NADH-quinone oxidoreductase subunit K